MAYAKKRVTIVNFSESKGRGVSWSENSGSEIFVSREIYNSLKSVISNKTIALDQTPNSAYAKFIYDMSVLHDIIILGNTDLTISEDVQYLDDYLGQIGVIETHPVSREIIQLPFFLNADYIPYEEK